MPITYTNGGLIVNPKQPKIYIYNNNTATNTTYFTALNATGIRGKLSKITLSSVNAVTNNFLNIRITIDGVVNSIGVPSQNYSVGMTHNLYNVLDYSSRSSIDYFCDITFYNSILVEFMQNSGSSNVLDGSILYSTE